MFAYVTKKLNIKRSSYISTMCPISEGNNVVFMRAFKMSGSLDIYEKHRIKRS